MSLIKRKKFHLVAGLVFTAVLFLLLPNIAHAFFLIDWAGDLITWLIGQLNSVLGRYILLPLINFVVQIIQYNSFLDSYAVQIGWPLVRDLANMFFVIILLFIAFSTILHISSYHYRNTLLKLVIMALLVNFSKPIVGFMIDFAQVIMLTFVSAFKQAAVSALAWAFGINLTGKLFVDVSQGIQPEDTLGTVILNLIFLVVASMVMLAYAAVLLYRIISLWILVILSPFAFLASGFPPLKKYSSEYWSKFWGQLTVGVMMAFCMWLAFMILAAGLVGGQPVTQELVGEVKGENKQLWVHIYTFMVAIALLLLALQYAQQAGGFAGSFAGKVSGRLSDWGSKAVRTSLAPVRGAYQGAKSLAKTGVKRGLHFAERRLLMEPSAREGAGRFARGLKYLTKAGWQGWAKRGDTLLEDSRQAASAHAHDDANRILGRTETSHALAAEEKMAKAKAEEMSISGLEDLKYKFSQALDMAVGAERDRTIQGLFAVASREAWVDDLMSIPRIMEQLMDRDSDEYRRYDELSRDQTEIRLRLEGEGLSGPDLDAAVAAEMMAKHGQEDAADQVEYINRRKSGDFFKMVSTDSYGNLSQAGLNLVYAHEQNAKSNGHYEDVGFTRVDERTGQLRMLNYRDKDGDGLTEADRMGLTEVSKLDPSQIVKMQAHSAGPRRPDGTNASPEEYHQNIQRIAGRSNEAYRLNPVGRTSNVCWGGTGVKSPVVEEKGAESAIIDFKSQARLETGLSTVNTDLNFAKATYFKTGADFVDAEGNIMNFRDGSNKGFMIFRHQDEQGNIVYRSIDSSGAVHEVEKTAEGKYITRTSGDEKGKGRKPKWETVEDFAGTRYKVVKRLGEEEAPGKVAEQTSKPAPETPKEQETQMSGELAELSQAIDNLSKEIAANKDTLKPEVLKEKQTQLEQKQKMVVEGNLRLAMSQAGLRDLKPATVKDFTINDRRYLLRLFKENTDNLRQLQRVLSKEMYEKMIKDLKMVESNLVDDSEFTNFFKNYDVT